MLNTTVPESIGIARGSGDPGRGRHPRDPAASRPPVNQEKF